MTSNGMNDVNPQRSIRNVPIAPRRRVPGAEEYMHEGQGFRVPPPGMPPQYERPRRSRFWFWALIVVIVCAALGAALSLVFTAATVTVVPRTASVATTNPIIASAEGQAAGASAEVLTFKQLSASASTTRSVAASGTKNISSAAQGTITIYNKYSTSPQTLVATTRFQTADGKLYRIHNTVTVPGEKKNPDGTIAPGSVSATAYADTPGPDYNIGVSQLSIPGFKSNQVQYNGFYATTNGISGGASGPQPIVLPSDADKARTDMQSELKNTLQSQLASEVPVGYMLIPTAVDMVYGAVSNAPGSGGSATLGLGGEAHAAIVKTSDLASAIATQSVQAYSGEPVDFASLSQVPLAMASDTPFTPSATTLSLSLAQPATLVWQVDEQALAAALAGKKKSDFNNVIGQYKSSIATAKAAMRPFWLTVFPSDPSKIHIKIQQP